MIPSAYLRVYQPLEGFERSERLHWERFLDEGRPTRTPPFRYAERETTSGLGLLVPVGEERADITVIDGTTFICPSRMRMRVLAATLSFWEVRPIELWDRFITKKDARRARRQLARHRRRDPDAVAFVHQSPWHVPIRWFVLFTDDERWLGEDERGELRLRYRTTTRRAMRRAAHAIPGLRRSDLGPIGELLIDLHQWLAAFDPRSIVELDYADLCGFLTWDELDDDHSARDVHDALDVLSAHEYLKAAEIYQGVLQRWAEIRGREVLN